MESPPNCKETSLISNLIQNALSEIHSWSLFLISFKDYIKLQLHPTNWNPQPWQRTFKNKNLYLKIKIWNKKLWNIFGCAPCITLPIFTPLSWITFSPTHELVSVAEDYLKWLSPITSSIWATPTFEANYIPYPIITLYPSGHSHLSYVHFINMILLNKNNIALVPKQPHILWHAVQPVFFFLISTAQLVLYSFYYWQVTHSPWFLKWQHHPPPCS